MKLEQSINGIAGAHSFEYVIVFVCLIYPHACRHSANTTANVEYPNDADESLFTQQIKRNKRGNMLPGAVRSGRGFISAAVPTAELF